MKVNLTHFVATIINSFLLLLYEDDDDDHHHLGDSVKDEDALMMIMICRGRWKMDDKYDKKNACFFLSFSSLFNSSVTAGSDR